MQCSVYSVQFTDWRNLEVYCPEVACGTYGGRERCAQGFGGET